MLQQFLERFLLTFVRAKSLGARSFRQLFEFSGQFLPSNGKHKKALIVGFFSMPVLGAVVAIAGAKGDLSISSSVQFDDVVTEAIQLNIPNQLVFSSAPLVREEKVKRGDSIASLLNRAGLKSDDVIPFLSKDPLASKMFQLKAGRVVSIQVDAQGDFQWMRYKTSLEEDHQEAILVKRDENGKLFAQKEKLTYETNTTFKSGRIKSSLFAAADEVQLPDSVAVQMAEIFSSEIDFHRELQKGDEFRVVYEQKTLDGREVSAGQVLAAEFINSGKSYKAYWFAPDGSRGAYYNDEGETLQKSFLKSPLAFSRISSGFTLRRFHPIMNEWRAHKGVDYAAPTGTPIRATANGTVTFVGGKNGYGRFIEIKHHANYSTAYAHLSNFAAGLRNGSKVSQGDVIGYVGSTGWATGPHLHYEFRVNNTAVDPQLVNVARAEPLDRVSFRKFKEVQSALDRRLDLSATERLAMAR